MLIIDSQSVKNTDTARSKGYDGNKKVSGIKRHIGVDSQGLPHCIHITTANINDRVGALEMIKHHKSNLNRVSSIIADSGYQGINFALNVYNIIPAQTTVIKRNEIAKFAIIPKRWIVERSFAWLDKCRRLWKNCEHYLNTSLQFVNLAFLVIALQRLKKDTG
jgi:transposase